MPTADTTRPDDDLDLALRDVFEYLALAAMKEGELDHIGRQLYKVISALLTSQESQGQLSPYREQWLRRIRSMDMDAPIR